MTSVCRIVSSRIELVLQNLKYVHSPLLTVIGPFNCKNKLSSILAYFRKKLFIFNFHYCHCDQKTVINN